MPPRTAQGVSSVDRAGPWVRAIAPRPNPRIRLIVFPYAGGGPQMTRGWAASLPGDVEVLAIQWPGRGVRLSEPALSSVIEMAERISMAIHDELLEPYALYGHSLGALTAFELARRRAWQGDPAPQHLFAAAYRAPQLPRTGPMLHKLPEADLLRELDELGGMPPEILVAPELLAAVLPGIRADLRAADTYRYRPGPPLTCSITAIGGSTDRTVSSGDLEAWREQTVADFHRIEVSGGHFFVNERPAELLAVVGRELASAR